MQKFEQILEKLEAQLEAKYPTPQVLLELINKEQQLTSKFWSDTSDGYEIETAEKREAREADANESRSLEQQIHELALSENHLLTLVRRHIFIHDLTPDELNKLTMIDDFSDQLIAHPGKLYDCALLETLITNNINTAHKYNDLIDAYFALDEMLDVRNYAPIADELQKFVGLDILDDLIFETTETFTDEETDESITFARSILILPKGIVTERMLHDVDHDQIMNALQHQLNNVIAIENYELARTLQTQLDNLK